MSSLAKASTGLEKASILLIALGKKYSAEVFKHLREHEIEQLTLSIANCKMVDAKTSDKVIEEFYELCLAQNFITEGGIEYAREVLNEVLGEAKANKLIDKVTSYLKVRPFDYLRKADPSQIFNLIQNENTQTIALIFSYLEPQQAALVLGSMPQEKQVQIIEKIANMDRTSPEYTKEVERVLEKKFSSIGIDDYTTIGGIESIVDILKSVDIGIEKGILETLDKYNEELAEQIRSKMFTFADIVKLDSRSIQKVLREISHKDLALALKDTTKEVKDFIENNISARLRDMINEDIEFMGPVRIKDVEVAQQKIVNIIRHLEDIGEIIISRNEGDDVIV